MQPKSKGEPESMSVKKLVYLEGARDIYILERMAGWVHAMVCHWLGKEHGGCFI